MERVVLLADAAGGDGGGARALPGRTGGDARPGAARPGPARGCRFGPSSVTHLLQTLRETNWNISRTRGAARHLAQHGRATGSRSTGFSPTRRPCRLGSRWSRDRKAPSPAAAAARAQRPRRRCGWERRRLAFLRAMRRWRRTRRPGATRVLQMLVEKVQSFGGLREELSASGIIAVFGLEPVEDSPRRAANAAMAIRKAVERARADSREWQAPVKLVVHVGQFLVGRLDGGARLDEEARRATSASPRRHRSARGNRDHRGQRGGRVFAASALRPGAGRPSAPQVYRLASPRARQASRRRVRLSTFVGRRAGSGLAAQPARSRPCADRARSPGSAARPASASRDCYSSSVRVWADGRWRIWKGTVCLTGAPSLPSGPRHAQAGVPGRRKRSIRGRRCEESERRSRWWSWPRMKRPPIYSTSWVGHDIPDRVRLLTPEVLKARTLEMLRELVIRRESATSR